MSELGSVINLDPGEDIIDNIAFGEQVELPPEDPIVPPGKWMRENLFSSISNGVQTVLFAAFLLFIIRWFLGLVFDEATNWAAVATNIRLLFTFNYPVEQFVRVWFSLGAIFMAMGLTVSAWNLNIAISLRRLAINLSGFGGLLLIFGALAPGSAPSNIRIGLFVVGGLLVAGGLAVIFGVSEPHHKRVPFEALLISLAVFVIGFVWFFPLGKFQFSEGEVTAASGTVAASTQGPWTVMMVILVGSFFAGKALNSVIPAKLLRASLILWWVVGPAFLIFLVLRDPAFDWGYVWRVDIPMAVAFGFGGGALLYLLTKPGRGDLAHLVGAALVLFAAYTWLGRIIDADWLGPIGGGFAMLQKARISFALLALFALMAPTFAGEPRARLRFAGNWLGLIVISHWLITGINTPSTLEIAAPPFLGGFVLGLALSYYVMLASFPLGILMALARTSKMPIFRVMSTLYIEFVRGVPLITVLFFFSIMLNLFLPPGMGVSELAAIFIGYSLFSSAYMAENIRGGLQSVRQGQYEAADALGLTTVQRTTLIVMPQTLRVSIPNLVGATIATFKETSLVSIVGGFELVRVANQAIPGQPDFIGQNRPALLFISLVFWVVSYSMSRGSRSLERRLGVGTGR